MNFAAFEPAPHQPTIQESKTWTNIQGYGSTFLSTKNSSVSYPFAKLQPLPNCEYLNPNSINTSVSYHPFNDTCCKQNECKSSNHHCVVQLMNQNNQNNNQS